MDNMLFDANNSSLKLLREGTGSVVVPILTGVGEQWETATIAHGYGSDLLIWEVGTDASGVTGGSLIPWTSNDGRVWIWAKIDDTNLTIVFNHNDSGGSGFPSKTYNYYYRILIP